MMPSRGLRMVQGIVPGTIRTSSRFYSTSRSSTRSQSLLFPSTIPRLSSTKISVSIASSQIFRHASTNSSIPEIPTASNIPNIDTLTLDDIDFATATVSAAAEKMGYLKEIGIDYGIGPTSLIQYVLEAMHIQLGMSWWLAIVGTAVVFRLLTLPLFLRAADTSARAAALAPVMKPISAEISRLRSEGNQAAAQQQMLKLLAIRRSAGIRLRDQFVAPLAQGVIGYCGFKLLRAMAVLPVPGLHDGGIFWLTDLTLPDGYLALPAAMAICTHFMIRLGGETGANAMDEMNKKMLVFMQYGLPVIIFFVTAWQPGSLCVWFAATGAFSIVQSLMLRQRTIRQIFKIPPLVKSNVLMPGADPLSSQRRAPQPLYQAPNIRTASSPRTINTTLVKGAAKPTGRPNDQTTSGNGVLTSTWSNVKDKLREQRKIQAQKAEKRRAEQVMADAFEQEKRRRR